MKVRMRFECLFFMLIAFIFSVSANVSATIYNVSERDKDRIYVKGDVLYNNEYGHLHEVYIYIDDTLKAKLDYKESYTIDCSEDVYCKYADFYPNPSDVSYYYISYPKDEQPAPEVSVNDKQYDGTQVPFSIGPGIGTMTYYFVGINGTDYPETITPPSKVGDFSLNVRYSGDKTIKSWSGSYNFSITGTGNEDENRVLLTVPEHVSATYSNPSLGDIGSGTDTRVLTNESLTFTAKRYFFIMLGADKIEAQAEENVANTPYTYNLTLDSGIGQDAVMYEQTLVAGDYFRFGDNVTLRANEMVSWQQKGYTWDISNNMSYVTHKLCLDTNEETAYFEDSHLPSITCKNSMPQELGLCVSSGSGTVGDPYTFGINNKYRLAAYAYNTESVLRYVNGDQIEDANRTIIVDVTLETPIKDFTNSRRLLSYDLPFKVECTSGEYTYTVASVYKEGRYTATVPNYANPTYSSMLNTIIRDIYIDEANLPYTLSFNTNGADAIEDQTVLQGASPQKPSDPAREGYTFVGWYRDAEFAEEFDFDLPLDQNTTIYAKWSMTVPQNYSVKYKWDGENCTAVITFTDGSTDAVEMVQQTDGTWTGSYNGETITTKKIGIKAAEKSFIRQKNSDGTPTDKAVIAISVGLDPDDGVSITKIGFVVQIGNIQKAFTKTINAYAANYKLTLKIPSDKEITYYYFYEKSDGSEPAACEAVTEYPLV